MKQPKDTQTHPHSARALLNRLAASLATLARCAEQIARHVPDAPATNERAATMENPHPPRKRGRPVKYHSQAEREAARRAQWKASTRRRRAAAKLAPADPTDAPTATAPRLCTPGDMPRQPLRVGACYALGMRYSAIAAALDMPKGSLRNAMHRFNQHAGLTSIDQAKEWFDAMHADPAAHAPHADRRQWAMAYAKRATTEAKRKAARKAWKARRSA